MRSVGVWCPTATIIAERQRGGVLFQEHLEVAHEWRLVRIGDAYFGHAKALNGNFHSGSCGNPPEPRHLHDVTELGAFRSMDVDVFETRDGRLLVNELQTVLVHPRRSIKCALTALPGAWCGEMAGDLARNACANARVLDVLDRWPG